MKKHCLKNLFVQPSKSLPALAATTALAALLAIPVSAQEYSTQQEDTEAVLAPDAFSPYAGRHFPQKPLL